MSRAKGIDVSDNQGVFNWAAWRGEIQFAEAKASQGLSEVDSQFYRNWEEMKSMGLLRFAYHYADPNEDPVMQAHHFTGVVREAGLITGKHYVDQLVIDFETAGALKPVQASFWARTFCTTVNRIMPGHRIIVQTFPAFIEKGNCAGLGPWPLWLMDWNVAAPVMPAGPWRTYSLWQDATGHVDRDVYNGTLGDLTTFCATTGKI